MPKAIGQRQEATVSHRMNFWGRPSGNSTVSWDYKSQKWVVKRPDDGSPALHRTVRCEVCNQSLRYAIHSVEATRRRQARRRAGAYAGLVVLLVSLTGLINVTDAGPVRIALTVTGILAGAVVGWVCMLATMYDTGVTGHGAGWPGATKHAVELVEPRPEGMPELVCERCGHREEYPWGSQYRKGFVEKQYQAAATRLENHTCPAA
ncbi:hypothetical protein KQY30_29090 [Streptomyces sp. GMY02]|uniref:hypothetical protein n=1 Tax=Streptomyces sp. GMY02 TaxID=1333528 RepID=UPI001C2C6CA2|nr:hypothetical protein [Streptomyces sp. GMY02]QXE37680.1 hypothetical protein KQY30_29090 [Streptomyces sp. GMY02]